MGSSSGAPSLSLTGSALALHPVMHTTIACVMGGLSVIRALGREGIPVASIVTPEKKQERTSFSRYVHRTLNVASALTDAAGVVEDLVRFGSSFPDRPVLFADNDD